MWIALWSTWELKTQDIWIDQFVMDWYNATDWWLCTCSICIKLGRSWCALTFTQNFAWGVGQNSPFRRDGFKGVSSQAISYTAVVSFNAAHSNSNRVTSPSGCNRIRGEQTKCLRSIKPQRGPFAFFFFSVTSTLQSHYIAVAWSRNHIAG